jgi:hypothetical protein
MSRHPLGKRAMSGVERNRKYLARLRQRAAAASAPPPPSRPSLPTPRWAESREAERAGASQVEGLIESGWSFNRIERFLAGGAKTLARHREAAEGELGGS